MAGVAAPYLQPMIGAIMLAMIGMSMSISLRRESRAAPGEQLVHNVTQVQSAAEKQSLPTAGVSLGDNVKIYEPQTSTPVGSLILLMGMGGDHSWDMSEWWYLDKSWSSKSQEWCCKDPSSMECTCWFDDNDKAAVQRLRSNLRIVDARGKIHYRNGNVWYKYQWWPDGPVVTEDHEAAISNVFQIIEHEYKIVGSYKRIAVAGMSQGADLALTVGVRFPQQLGMVISQRGMLHGDQREWLSSHGSHAGSPGTPFILMGGDSDELIPLSTFKESCASLQHSQTPAFLKTRVCYDESWGCHGSFSKSEWKLLINAFSLMLFPVHERNWGDQIGQLTFWNSCEA